MRALNSCGRLDFLGVVRHSLRFTTFFTPGSIKTLRLYALSNFRSYNNTFSCGKLRAHNKILIKQSYVILAWLGHVSGGRVLLKGDAKASMPSFFVHPLKNHKITLIKSPMAHKTFSQEQFMVRYYSLSLTFSSSLGQPAPLHPRSCSTKDINNQIYYTLFILGAIPNISTNMLFLSKYSLLVSSPILSSYFSYFSISSVLAKC